MIKLKPTYVPLIQKPHTCAAACMQMILHRNGCGLHNQEDIAIHFGIKVSAESAAAFSDDMPIAKRGEPLGLSTIGSAEKIQRTLAAFGAQLQVKAFRASQIDSLDEFLIEHLERNEDLWVEYDASNIHANDARLGAYIHDGLVERIDPSSGSLILIDSMPDHRQRISVSINEISAAIAPVGRSETGFIVVRKAT